jgi:Ca-activated chloride channel family protein
MTFSDPRWLWLLLALPVLALLEWRVVRSVGRRLERLVGKREPHPLLAHRLLGVRRTGFLLRGLALACLIVGAAGPEWGEELVRRSASGSDVVFAIDVSASMDARDVPPSRIEEARREALSVLERLGGSRVGVVAFAGDAVRLCPLTLDRAAVRLVLESLSSGTVSEPGTDLGRGLRAAAKLMPAGRRTEQAIVVWTDGEDLESGAVSAIDELARGGSRVFTVGVGTPAGDVVPVLDPGGRAVDVKRDEGGAAVRSRLDEPLLRDLARRTRGAYFSASRPGGETLRLLATLGGLARSERGQRLVERTVPRFPWFAGAAALLLAFDTIRRRRVIVNVGGRKDKAARTAAAAAVIAMLMFPIGTRTASAQTAWAKGDQAFKAGRWAEAESLYTIRMQKGAKPEIGVNRATARAKAGRTDEGEAGLEPLAPTAGKVGQIASYNLGTLRGERGDTDRALASLRKALERDPTDEDARFNYEWVLRHRRLPPKKPSSGGSQQPQPSPSQPSPGGQQPQPQQQRPSPGQPPQSQTTPQQRPQPQRGMTREQADRILGSLEQLERLEQQRVRQVRVMREKRGKDW